DYNDVVLIAEGMSVERAATADQDEPRRPGCREEFGRQRVVLAQHPARLDRVMNVLLARSPHHDLITRTKVGDVEQSARTGYRRVDVTVDDDISGSRTGQGATDPPADVARVVRHP